MDETSAGIPAVVAALAASVPQVGPLPPRPIAWAEKPAGWVIVFEDGRKLTFRQASVERPVKQIAPAVWMTRVSAVENASQPAAVTTKKGKGKK